MNNLNISIELANKILAYLGSRPYGEVFQLIQAIQEAAKPLENSETTKPGDQSG